MVGATRKYLQAGGLPRDAPAAPAWAGSDMPEASLPAVAARLPGQLAACDPCHAPPASLGTKRQHPQQVRTHHALAQADAQRLVTAAVAANGLGQAGAGGHHRGHLHHTKMPQRSIHIPWGQNPSDQGHKMQHLCGANPAARPRQATGRGGWRRTAGLAAEARTLRVAWLGVGAALRRLCSIRGRRV